MMGVLGLFMGLPSWIKKYIWYALVIAAFALSILLYVNNRDKRLIAQDRLQSELTRRKKLHDIKTRQIAAANNRLNHDELIKQLLNDKSSF